MKRYSPVFLLILLLAWGNLSAQSREDSLRNACKYQKDSLQTDAYLLLGKLYFTQFSNDDSLIVLSKQALRLASKSGNKTQLYQAKKQVAVGYVHRNDSASAVVALKSALDEASSAKDHGHMADIFHLYAALYGNLGITDTSLAYLIREVEYAQLAKSYNALAIAYSSIAWIYRDRGQYDRTLFYHRKALDIVDKMELTNIGNIIQVYVTCAEGYTIVGKQLKNNVLMDSSKILADSVLALALRHNRLAPMSSAYYVYSQHAMYYKQYGEAIEFSLNALKYRQYIPERTMLILYTNIALSYANMEQSEKAINYLDSAQSLPAGKELYYLNHLADVAYNVYRLSGNFEKALQAHELFLTTKDSLNSKERTRSINEIEQKFNKAENERQIQQLAQEKEIAGLNIKLLTVGVIGVSLLALLVFVFYRQRALKNEQSRMQIEQRLNRARMDPHFLFNTFTALQSYVLREKEPIKVAGFLSDYAVIMRQTLESTYEELIVLEEEISYLDKYLELQQMRTGGKFNFSISVSDEIDPTELLIPGMVIQPFVENCIEHGFANLDYPGQLNIIFGIADNELLITITDNGSGLAKNEKDKGYPSRATGIIKDRILLLNKKHKSNARYTLEANSTGRGITVTMQFPILK